MKVTRVILSGTLVWILTFSFLTILTFVPIVREAEIKDEWIVSVLIVPLAYLGAFIYYKNGEKTNGLIVGLFLASIALILDAIITVPFTIMPQGNYWRFFTSPLLWVIVVEYVVIVFLYWKKKIDNYS